jgi:putative CocE/NonD family hydrolase
MEAMVVPGVCVERNVEVEMRDGTILRADIYRPEISGELPVILIRLPYDKTQSENLAYAHPAWYASNGYIVVCQDTRGRYRSEGCFYPFRDETNDGVDTIAWASCLPGSTGKVGMYGFSYGGATQLLPARERPEALTAICPGMTGSQYFEGWTYRQGALSLAFVASWALSLGIESAARRGDNPAAGAFSAAFASALEWDWFLPLNQFPPLKNEDTSYFFDWLEHSTYDDYWHQWSIDAAYHDIDVPALHVAGWYDIFLAGTVRNYVGLRMHAGSEHARQNQRLVIGPWYHIPWRPLTQSAGEPASPLTVDDWQISWFDRHLKGINTTEPESALTLYVLGENTWRSFSDWPPPQSIPTPLYLHSKGRANSVFGDGSASFEAPADERPDLFTYDPVGPVESYGGHSCCFPDVAPMGPANQFDREDWNTVLVYTSEPLSEAIYLIGDASMQLFAASTAVDTDWTVRLCVVDAEGISLNVQEGIVRARFRESLSQPILIIPGEIYRYEIPLGPVGIRIDSGERLRVQISSSDFPQWDRNLNNGGVLGADGLASAVVATQTVFHDAARPSHMLLPIVREL